MPQRIQRKRTKGWTMPLGAVYVGRPSVFGNPFKIGEINTDTGEAVTPEKCLEYFEFYLTRKYKGPELDEFLAPLRGKDLACWCKVPEPGNPSPCHADVLLRLANPPENNYSTGCDGSEMDRAVAGL